MKRTVLVTGAGGFLAGHAVKQFRAAGWKTIGIGRSDAGQQAQDFDAFLLNDLADVSRIVSALERYAPEAIVHLAAPSSVPQSVRDPLADFIGHVLPTGNLLEAVRRSGLASRFLLISSAAVYGNPATSPISEAMTPAPISPYGFHKLQQETLVDEYVALHGLRGCKARLFSTYGENLRRLAVWEIARRALAGDLRVHGTGEETRDYLYAEDVARAMVSIVEHAAFAGETINVASGEAVSIRELATQIFALLGITDAPQFLQDPLPGSPRHWRADVTRLRALGFAPPSWSVGLGRVVEWIQNRA